MAPPAGARHGARRAGTQIRHLRRPRRRACLHAPSCCLSRRVVPVVAPRAKGRHATPCMWPHTLPHARRRRIPPRHLRHVGVAKASGMLLNGRPSSTPPRIDGRPSSSHPPRTHTHRGRACVELRSSSQLPNRELRSSSQEAPRRPTRRPACTQLPNRATCAHATGSSEAQSLSSPSSQRPHRATSHRRELTGAHGSSRELRGLSPRR
jgi:hypothetical protein